MQTTRLENLRHYHLKLGPGADLFQGLRDFLVQEGLRRAFVLSTIGSLKKVVVNFPQTHDIPPRVGSLTLEGLFEINGLSGEVWQENGQIRVHLHGTVTQGGTKLHGGGLGEGAQVLLLAEMVIAGVE
jgi:predicted DNA-binding protein with PD1-like motif